MKEKDSAAEKEKRKGNVANISMKLCPKRSFLNEQKETELPELVV